MERMPGDSARSKEKNSSAIWWPPDFVENFQSVSLDPEQSTCIIKNAECISHMASQMLWSTGTFSGSIPDGFFSVIPDRNLKEIFSSIPSPDDLHSLGMDGFKADIILVDTEKDKKLSMLKQLSAAMVKGLHSNPALLIKKIAGLVYDFYKRPNSGKSAGNDTSPGMDNKGIQLLGQIRHGSCRPRAILFKVLADFVGLQSKLVVGLPIDGGAACADSYKHMSVMVVLKSVELLVDLMRFPGQLIPFSTKAIILSHISAAGESDSAENDSCDSPLEPNSPLYDFPDKVEVEGPEHPLSRARVWSMLSGDRQSRRKLADGVDSSRLDGTRASNVRRIRRRSISITPEIGDDIVRAVRAMNETLKQNRLLQDRGDDVQCSFSTNVKTQLNPPTIEEISFGHSGTYSLRNQTGASQKAVSLPSSPPEYIGKISERIVDSPRMEAMLSTWNNVLQSSSFLNKPLLPFEEWSINFSELTVGTRVGIGLFGEVFRGIWNGTDVAIKVFLEQDLTRENMEDFCNEIYILSRLRHPNVILFLGACVKPPHLSLVTEYMEMGSLYYLMHTSGQKKKLSWRKRLRMLRDICRGLMCIHRLKIVHRDLKSANCLVDKHGSVKICDFGLSRVSDGPLRDNSSAGTPEWMAPELIRNEPFTEKCDIFSLGVIMWELRTLCRPWEGIPAVQVISAVAHQGTRLEIPEGPLGKLISDCWAEPQDRPTCQEILTRLLDCEYAFS